MSTELQKFALGGEVSADIVGGGYRNISAKDVARACRCLLEAALKVQVRVGYLRGHTLQPLPDNVAAHRPSEEPKPRLLPGPFEVGSTFEVGGKGAFS